MSSINTTGDDAGYIFSGPKIEKRNKMLRNGTAVVAYHQTGVMVNENPMSPWHHATFFAQGTAVRDQSGQVIQEVALWETIDADGDLTWGILWCSANSPDIFQFTSGTGKWKGIAGTGNMLDVIRDRADNHFMPAWEMSWHIEGQSKQDPIEPNLFTYHDTGLSFHGPHINDSAIDLKNGMTLVVNNQSGILISEDPKALSPRNYATNFDRGTTIQSMEGNTLGDVMLLEDTDPDGDIAWLYHEWWYGQGDGTYRFIGGTGKWKGINGVGKTLGILKDRTDDHFMLRSEIHWNIK